MFKSFAKGSAFAVGFIAVHILLAAAAEYALSQLEKERRKVQPGNAPAFDWDAFFGAPRTEKTGTDTTD